MQTESMFIAWHAACLFVILFAAPVALSAAEPEALKQDPQSDIEDSTDTPGHQRIEALVNDNEAPVLVGPDNDNPSRLPLFAVDFDWDEDKRVREAVRALEPDAEALWPAMVSHLNDERYCISIRSEYGTAYNWRVGDVCRRRMAAALSMGYYSAIAWGRKELWYHFNPPDVARESDVLKCWCRERNERALYELQMEMCEWAIEDLQTTMELEFISPETRQEWMKTIEANRQALATSKKAVTSNWLSGEFWSFFNSEKAEEIRKKYGRASEKP